jgi:uncharacterized membrane-anchored protein
MSSDRIEAFLTTAAISTGLLAVILMGLICGAIAWII